MNKQVDARELLITARDALLQSILPNLPEGLHYEARMIANAMRIASRELALGASADRLELDILSQLVGGTQTDTSISPSTIAEQIAKDQRTLCLAIRAGEFDTAGTKQEALITALTEITLAKLAISNPRAIHRG